MFNDIFYIQIFKNFKLNNNNSIFFLNILNIDFIDIVILYTIENNIMNSNRLVHC